MADLEQMWNDLKEQDEHSRLVVESSEQTIKIIQKIIDTRIRKGLSQRNLAQICGMKQPALARIESFKVIPQINTLIKIAEAVDLRIVLCNEIEKSLINIVACNEDDSSLFNYVNINYNIWTKNEQESYQWKQKLMASR